jgi:hypothetical protein
VKGRFDGVLPGDGAELTDLISHFRFTPRRFRESHEFGPVGTVLDQLEQAARAGEPFAPLPPTHLPRVKVREGYDIEQVDTFFGLLRARR